MKLRSGLILIYLSLLLASVCHGQSNGSYEDRRAEIVEQQNTTRQQIESLREQIETYTERLGFATERYEQMYQQYRELERVIALQQEQIRQMRLEQSQITQEIELIESNIDNNEERLLELFEEYKDILTFSYKERAHHGTGPCFSLHLHSTSCWSVRIISPSLTISEKHRSMKLKEHATN